MTRDETIQQARHAALHWIEKKQLLTAVIEFVAQAKIAELDPPLHHALVTRGILLAEAGDEPGVRQWLRDMK